MLIAEVYTTYCISTDMKEMRNGKNRVRVQDVVHLAGDSPDVGERVRSPGASSI